MENRNRVNIKIILGVVWRLLFYIAIAFRFGKAIFSQTMTSIEKIENYVFIICLLVIISFFKYVENGE